MSTLRSKVRGAFVAAPVGIATVLSTARSDASPSWYEETLLDKGMLPDQRLATCVAVRGDVAVVGVPPQSVGGMSNIGALRVFTRKAAAWMLTQTLTPPGPYTQFAYFGQTCAMSSDRLVVGAVGAHGSAGAAYVYVREGSAFVLEQKLVASDTTPGDRFGSSVALERTTIAVGQVRQSVAAEGAAYVFSRSGATWTFVQRISPPDTFATGRSLALEGNTLVVSSIEIGTNRGVVQTYERAGETFAPTVSLTASGGAEDNFGGSLALAGDTLVIGDSLAPDRRGRALVYRRDAGTWSLSTTLAHASLAANDTFGHSIAFSGDAFFIGAPRRGRGSVFVFERSGSTWNVGRELVVKGLDADADFGEKLAASSDVLLVGAIKNGMARGSAHVFRRGLGPGDPCTAASSCVSGFCVDAVCCNETCGGGLPSDCQACSRTAGAALDGTCGPAASTVVCRPAMSRCDQAEQCDGVTTTCPADAVVLNGTACPGGTCLVGRCTPPSTANPAPASLEPPAAPSSACGCRVAGGDGTSNDGALRFGAGVLALAFVARRRRLHARRRCSVIAAVVTCAACAIVSVRTADAASPAWREQSRLVPSPQARNRAGECVAVHGDVAIVGALAQDVTGPGGVIVDRGSVFVYRAKGTSWVLAQTIEPPAVASAGYFGSSCALRGDRMVIGGEEAAFVYKLVGAVWQLEQTLVGSDLVGREAFGRAVAIADDTILVSAPSRDSEKGAVYTFSRAPSGWSSGPMLTASESVAGSIFGSHLAFDGTTLAVTSPIGRGAVYAYTKTGSGWGSPQTLSAAAATSTLDHFGTSVAVQGDLLVASTQGANKPGSAVVFRRGGGGFREEATLAPSSLIAGDRFGASLAIEGATVFVGAWGHDKGSVFTFAPSGATWSLLAELVASAPGPLPAYFGTSLGISGDALLIGAPGNTDQPGEAYAFRLSLAVGDACSTSTACLTGFCVDGVCCNDACGDDKRTDCSVCSRAAGATTDGICGPAPGTLECRRSASTCDVAESCDGLSLICPANAVVTNGTACPEGVCLSGRCERSAGPQAGPEAGGATSGDPEASGCGCRTTSPARARFEGLILLALPFGAALRLVRKRARSRAESASKRNPN